MSTITNSTTSMASTHSSQVSFESSHNLNSSIDRKRNYVLTQKYDPVLTRRRLQIEEWMDEELREIYECDEDEDYDIEIDIDQLLECPADERCTYVKNILVEAKKPIDDFIEELLQKIKKLIKA